MFGIHDNNINIMKTVFNLPRINELFSIEYMFAEDAWADMKIERVHWLCDNKNKASISLEGTGVNRLFHFWRIYSTHRVCYYKGTTQSFFTIDKIVVVLKNGEVKTFEYTEGKDNAELFFNYIKRLAHNEVATRFKHRKFKYEPVTLKLL
jgi:hypothetical protein